jgi:hypothetical protein
MAKVKSKARKAPRKTPVKPLSGHSLAEALKDTHFKRAVRKEIHTAQQQLNRRMEQERYDEMTKGMSAAAQRDFDARVQLLRGEVGLY